MDDDETGPRTGEVGESDRSIGNDVTVTVEEEVTSVPSNAGAIAATSSAADVARGGSAWSPAEEIGEGGVARYKQMLWGEGDDHGGGTTAASPETATATGIVMANGTTFDGSGGSTDGDDDVGDNDEGGVHDDDGGGDLRQQQQWQQQQLTNNGRTHRQELEWESLRGDELRTSASRLLERVASLSSSPSADRSSTTTAPGSDDRAFATSTSSTSTLSAPAASEVPRWRFVNTAKKSLGYSSRMAGSHVRGKSAHELAAAYRAPEDDDDAEEEDDDAAGAVRGGEEKEDVEIGKVVLPSFASPAKEEDDDADREIGRVVMPSFVLPRDETHESYEANVRMQHQQQRQRQQNSPTNPVVDATMEKLCDGPKLHDLEERSDDGDETEDAVASSEEWEGDDEEAVSIAANGAEAFVVASMGAESNSPAPDDDGNDKLPETDASRRKYAKWGMCVVVLVLLGVIGALLGIMLGGDDEGDASSKLLGSSTTPGPTPAYYRPPLSGRTPAPTAFPTVVVVDMKFADQSDEVVTSADEYEDIIACPTGSTMFDLSVRLGSDPSGVTWAILDRCTREVLHGCEGCYAGSPPDHPVSYSGCLPNRDFQGHEGRGYVLQVTDRAGGGGSIGYAMRYGGEAVLDVLPDAARDYAAYSGSHNFGGERWECTDAPSGSPRPSQTSDIASKPGCTPFIETTSCGSNAEVEFNIMMPRIRGIESYDNRHFGSAVTFVGNAQAIVAIGYGFPSPYVHLFQRFVRMPGIPYWEYLATLQPPDSVDSNGILFGASLDSNDEGYISVGAPRGWSSEEATSGEVYVYKPNLDWTDWTMVATLAPRDNAPHPNFGAVHAMDGTLIAVGLPEELNGKGAVYVFEHSPGNAWAQLARLSPNALAEGASFGSSVSVFGDAPATVAAGAPGDAGVGSAWVFRRSDFSWSEKLLAPRDIRVGDRFGTNVVISGCTVAVSSPGEGLVGDDTTMLTTSGTVRIFDWDAEGDYWAHKQIVESSNELTSGAIFGQCIAMDGNTLVVGNPWGREGDTKSGFVHHFERIGGLWTLISIVVQEGHAAGDADEFACPLSLSGDMFIAGSRGDSSLGMNSGAAFIFDLCHEPPKDM